MKTIAIFDNEGKVLYTNTNISIVDTILTSKVIEVPEGKMIESLDPETKDPIFVDIPKTEIELLKEKLSYQEEINQELEAGLFDLALTLGEVLGGTK